MAVIHLLTIVVMAIIAHTAATTTGPVITGYYNVFSGYSVKGFGCMVTDPLDPLTIQSWVMGTCQPYMTQSGLQFAIFSMTTDHLTLYADVYSTSTCTGTMVTYKTGLSDQTQGCTWSYTTSSIPSMQQDPTTLAKVNDWTVTYYYIDAASCSAKSNPAFVYQGQVPVTTPCITECTLNSNGNGFYQLVQSCKYNPLYAPTAAPVPTQAPTNVTENQTAIIAGSVVGGVLFLALLGGLYYLYAGDKKEEDEYERLRVDHA